MQVQGTTMLLQSIERCVYHRYVSIEKIQADEKELHLILVKGVKIRPDPLPNRNDKRRDFCSRYDGYGDFCNGNYALISRTRNYAEFYRRFQCG